MKKALFMAETHHFSTGAGIYAAFKRRSMQTDATYQKNRLSEEDVL